MDFRRGNGGPRPSLSANDQIRANVRELLDVRRMRQSDLADKLGVSQPWVSKRLSGITPFQIEDLDVIADAFGLSPAQLMCDGIGAFNRRMAAHDRRSGQERRRLHLPGYTSQEH